MPRILFLAQFAPTEGVFLETPKSPEEKFYAETYHWKIIESLKKLNYDFDTASDIEYLINNYDKCFLLNSGSYLIVKNSYNIMYILNHIVSSCYPYFALH